MSQVVPYISNALICGQAEGPLKACEGHVVLLSIEATQAQVVEDLTVVDAHLEEASVWKADDTIVKLEYAKMT